MPDVPNVVECSKCGRSFVREAARRIGDNLFCPPCAQLIQSQRAGGAGRGAGRTGKVLLVACGALLAGGVGTWLALRERKPGRPKASPGRENGPGPKAARPPVTPQPVDMNPRSAAGWLALAEFHKKGRRGDEAAAAYRRAAALFYAKNDFAAAVSCGTSCEEAGRFVDAVEIYKRGTADQVFANVAWIALGNVYLKMKRCRQAVAAHEKSVALSPKFGNAWCYLGIAYASDGQDGKAREVWARLHEEFRGKVDSALLARLRKLLK